MSVSTLGKESFADTLLAEGLIDRSQYNKAVAEHEKSRRSYVRIFCEMGALDENKRIEALRKTTRCKVISLRDVMPSAEILAYVDRDFCRRRLCIPVEFREGSVVVAMDDPTDIGTLNDLEKLYGRPVRPVIAPHQEIVDLADRLPRDHNSSSGQVVVIRERGTAIISTLSLALFVFIPIVVFYYFVASSDSGKDWYQSLELNKFETALMFMVVWGSWASISYFINDLIFGKPNQS